MTLYCAIDLHSNNNVPVVIDDNDQILFQKRLPNDLATVIDALKPFQDRLLAIAVESTFNWYWLVDGLIEQGYELKLVNTSAVAQYNGIKHTNDQTDAFHLAHLMRLGILPTGYIYPKEQRAIRDLCRKRLQMVQHRVTHMLSAQNQLWRSTGENVSNKQIKKADFSLLNKLHDVHAKMALKSNLNIIADLNREIEHLENKVYQCMSSDPSCYKLQTINGVGPVLATTIRLETGDINRFEKVGNYASYARCVTSQKLSNNKKKGVNNRKNGNKYLSWAFVEAAHSIIRYDKTAHKFYQRKRAQANGALATKALANKLARAAYYILRDNKDYDGSLLFS